MTHFAFKHIVEHVNASLNFMLRKEKTNLNALDIFPQLSQVACMKGKRLLPA